MKKKSLVFGLVSLVLVFSFFGSFVSAYDGYYNVIYNCNADGSTGSYYGNNGCESQSYSKDCNYYPATDKYLKWVGPDSPNCWLSGGTNPPPVITGCSSYGLDVPCRNAGCVWTPTTLSCPAYNGVCNFGCLGWEGSYGCYVLTWPAPAGGYCSDPYIPPSCSSACTSAYNCGPDTGPYCSGRYCGTLPSGGCQIGYSCSSTIAPGQCISNTIINTSYWTNLRCQDISTAQVGDTVRMVAGGLFDVSKDINYTVYKNATYFWIIHTVQTLFTTSSSDLWTPTETADGIWFKASMGNIQNTSNLINITSLSNSPPEAKIDSPTEGYKVAVNTPISFTQSSYDDDDLLNITWDFGDGTPTQQTSSSYSLCSALTSVTGSANTTHNYSIGGKYTVTLSVKNARGQTDTDTRTIDVFQKGINVKAIISEPEKGIYTGEKALVDFNASTSYVANCSTNTCSAGTAVPDVHGTNCCYVHFPNSKTYSGAYTITMNWTLTTEGSTEVIKKFGDWVLNYSDVVEFTQNYWGISGTTHTAVLDMIYNE